MLNVDMEEVKPVTKRLIDFQMNIVKNGFNNAYMITSIYNVFGEEEYEQEEFDNHIDAYALMDKLERKQRMQKLQTAKWFAYIKVKDPELYNKVMEKMAK